jgi:alpha-amylase/alpha-mannosidase (GH57 family)
MPDPVLLALVWHMHQPLYLDLASGAFRLPWTRLHATKDYRDMPALLKRTPGVHVTFNLTPSLLDQLDLVARGVPDPYLAAARAPAEGLTLEQRTFLLSRFFDVQRERMLEPHPRYRELAERARSDSVGRWSAQDLRDLQVWFHLAWVDPSFRKEEPIRSLLAKGRGFGEEEKGALLDWGSACAGLVEAEYRSLESSGQCELSTSAYYHPILPLLIDTEAPREVSSTIRLPSPPARAPEDAEEQVLRAIGAHARRFGSKPRGTWPPEGAVNDATLELLAGTGFEWAASDEALLSAALGGVERGPDGWPAPIYRPHRVETARGPIAMLFRDRKLSDLIGFTYAHWDPEHAAHDFYSRVRNAREAVRPGEIPIVTVILDGENCWESYANDGEPFLRTLYGLLDSGGDVRAVTVSEALARVSPGGRLHHVPVGSWIRSDLGIWVGHPDKTHAWEELGAARSALDRARRAGADAAAAREAREEILAAEASDWFWWYGDDHPSEHRHEFDALFRARLIRAYEAIGAAVPASLQENLREDASVEGFAPGGEGMEADLPDRPAVPYVRPIVDGRETEFFEWRRAALYRAAGAMGNMHRASALLREVRFGTDGKALHVRLDFVSRASELRGASVSLFFPGPPERTVRAMWAGAGRGSPEWVPEETGEDRRPESGEGGGPEAGEPGSYAVDEIAEISLPLARFGQRPGRVRFRVRLECQGSGEEIAPGSGWFLLPLPEHDLDLAIWTAL